jgi:hypothetical protein
MSKDEFSWEAQKDRTVRRGSAVKLAAMAKRNGELAFAIVTKLNQQFKRSTGSTKYYYLWYKGESTRGRTDVGGDQLQSLGARTNTSLAKRKPARARPRW